ncbi:MAG TPA: (2Fe-2S)-binding protein [Anaerolineae bacterium]|nr:(2Fe-2S)-binding protein [Anaerolineae bacterium]
MPKLHLALTVNGEPRELLIDPRRTLLDVLRNQLELRGTHRGCDTGNCGACTVILNGRLVTSCMVLAADCDGADVLTVEGISPDGQLHPVQRALVEQGGIQCGYCTPGMVMASVALLNANPQPTEEEVRMGLAGNLCRCTGYKKIVEAVLAVAGERNSWELRELTPSVSEDPSFR